MLVTLLYLQEHMRPYDNPKLKNKAKIKSNDFLHRVESFSLLVLISMVWCAVFFVLECDDRSGFCSVLGVFVILINAIFVVFVGFVWVKGIKLRKLKEKFVSLGNRLSLGSSGTSSREFKPVKNSTTMQHASSRQKKFRRHTSSGGAERRSSLSEGTPQMFSSDVEPETEPGNTLQPDATERAGEVLPRHHHRAQNNIIGVKKSEKAEWVSHHDPSSNKTYYVGKGRKDLETRSTWTKPKDIERDIEMPSIDQNQKGRKKINKGRRGLKTESQKKKKWNPRDSISSKMFLGSGTGGEAAGVGWSNAMDPATGKEYFYNAKTGETKWADAVTSVAEESGVVHEYSNPLPRGIVSQQVLRKSIANKRKKKTDK